VSSQFKTRVFLIHRMAAVFLMMVIYGWQMFHRVLTINGKTHSSWALEMVHMVSTSIWGIYMFFGFGITYDNIQLLVTFWSKKILNRNPESELTSPVVVTRAYKHVAKDLLGDSDDSTGFLATTPSTRPPWLTTNADLASPVGSINSRSTASSANPSFSFSGTGLTGYAAKKPFGSDGDDSPQ